MKYIKKIVLKNFQSHKYTEIDLNKELNIIVGPSDSGKTAILRALKWVLYNEPAGDFFIREGEKEATVTLTLSDNTRVTRYRSKSKNAYEVIYNNGKSLRLEGFGTGVPDEIKEALGIYKISLDDKENNSINLAEQLEGPFLLSEKTSTRASAIGQLVGVDVLDEALREVLRDVRALNIKKRGLEEEVNDLKEEIKSYDYLESLKTILVKVTNIREELSESEKLLEKLGGMYKSLNAIDSEKLTLVKINNRLRGLKEIDEILNTLESKYGKHMQLTNYMKNLNRVRRNLASDIVILKELKELDGVSKIKNKLVEAVNEHKRLLNIQLNYNRIKEEKITLTYMLEKLYKYLDEEPKLKKVETIYKKLEKLNILKEKYLIVKSSIDKGNKYIKSFDNTEELIRNKNELEESIEMLNKLNKLYSKIVINAKNINDEKGKLEKINKENTYLLNKYKSLLNRFEKCPLCFSEIDNHTIEHIMDHYIGG